MKPDRNYNPELDRHSEIKELRSLYKATSESSRKEDIGEGYGESVSDKVSAYFEWEKAKGE